MVRNTIERQASSMNSSLEEKRLHPFVLDRLLTLSLAYVYTQGELFVV